jgi:hypothetical protein
VRLLLIPAAMRLLGERNWYLPRWLAWLPNVQVEGPRPAPEGPLPAPLRPAPALVIRQYTDDDMPADQPDRRPLVTSKEN